MDTLEKLRVLAADSQYDLACACGTSDDERRKQGADGGWLYPVPLAAGGKGIMFKTLISNACSSDCSYCPLRSGTDVRRCSMSPDEVADSFLEHSRRQWLMGLFLSSGVQGSADHTMEKLVGCAEILRRKHKYRGYIHLKVIPGASEAAIDAALRVSSAVSLNIEVPGKKHCEKLSKYKNFDTDIVAPLKYIAARVADQPPAKRIRTTTQFIVGASDETDGEIVKYLDGLYNRLKIGRVYFSAYSCGGHLVQPCGGVLQTAKVAEQVAVRELRQKLLVREHRLYQADFLLRKYGFDAGELVFDEGGNFSLDADPKLAWAQRHPEKFPISIARGSREELLRVPGLGTTYVERIIKCRKQGRIASLADIGLRGKNAKKASAFCSAS